MMFFFGMFPPKWNSHQNVKNRVQISKDGLYPGLSLYYGKDSTMIISWSLLNNHYPKNNNNLVIFSGNPKEFDKFIKTLITFSMSNWSNLSINNNNHNVLLLKNSPSNINIVIGEDIAYANIKILVATKDNFEGWCNKNSVKFK